MEPFDGKVGVSMESSTLPSLPGLEWIPIKE